jgi:ABC-2 type transport system permease protein
MTLKRLQTYWRIFWKFRSLRFMMLLEYRSNFWFWVVVSIMWTTFNFFFFDLIIGARGELAGWNRDQMYILISTFTMIDAFTWSFFYSNMQEYTSSIFNGEMTFTLTKPIDPQFLLSVQQNSYTNVARFLIGLGILLLSIKNGQFTITAFGILGYLFFCGVALMFVYSLWFFIATFAFWVERLENINELVPATRRIWQVPKEVYTGLASTLFTVLVPVSLIATLPSELLIGKVEAGWLLYFFCFSSLFFLASRAFFQLSIRKYSGIGN